MLAERVALVTGGSRGIGRAIAERLARDGASVAVNYRAQAQAADEVVRGITAHGGRAVAIAADVAQAADVDRLVQTAIETFGRLDILVNNAGITRDNLLLRLPLEDWDTAREVASRGITVNALAPGYIDTEMSNDVPESARERVRDLIPLARAGSAAEVAAAAAFLASDEAAYITGQVLNVDGGLVMA